MTGITGELVLVWIGLALVLAVVELVTLDLIFLMLAGSALAGALLAAVGVPFPLQVVLAVVAGLLLVGVLRPTLVRRMQAGPGPLTGTAALVGRPAQVVETVTETGGRVTIGGEVWSARTWPVDPISKDSPATDPLTPGRAVLVVAIEGATAVVSAQPSEPQDTI
jgi:membrane protein implicated in regulation of membrane protease activity